MSTALIWIFIPLLLAIILFGIRRWKSLMVISGILSGLVLAWLAWQLPLGEPIDLGAGLPPLVIAETQTVLGRPFIINQALRPALLMIYFSVVLWFGGATVSGSTRLFVPFGLAIAALLTASISMSPVIFAVIILEFVAILCIPILSPPGKPVNRGVLRFLVYHTMGICLILIGDQLIPLSVVGAGNELPWLRATVVLALGFALIGGVLPFHTWITMIAEEVQPYTSAFVFYLNPTALSFLMLDYLILFNNMGAPGLVYDILRLSGVVMILGGGLWAAFERHLGRIMGYTALVQIGMSMLAMSLPNSTTEGMFSIGILFAQRIPQGIGLLVWGLGLTAIQNKAPRLTFNATHGMARRFPVASASIVLANLSLAGIPLLASFPLNLAFFGLLARQSTALLILVLAGNAGVLVAALRTLAVLVMDQHDNPWRVNENRLSIILLVAGWAILFVVGLMPQRFFPYLVGMAQIFTNPIP